MQESSVERRRLPVVGVMGSGSVAHEPLASSLGRALARLDVHLLTGGGGGVMAEVSRGFFDIRPRRGLIVGVIPGSEGSGTAPEGYPNEWVEIVIRTHLPLSGERGTETMSRNHVNVLSSDVVVALPGGEGTRSEMELAIRYARPVVSFVPLHADSDSVPVGVHKSGTLDGLVRFVRRAIAEGPSRGDG